MKQKFSKKYFFPRRAFAKRRFCGGYKSNAGFTIIELVVSLAIFTILIIAFISILVSITSIYSRQTGVAEVNQQSQFLLQQIQYYVERSSMIELNPDVSTTTLKLRMAADAEDPTYIYLVDGILYLKQTDAGTPAPLTTNRVIVSDISFIKRQNAPAHDSVSVSFVVAFNTQNLKQKFSEALQTAVARVSAATFDSNIIPSSTNTYKLGLVGQVWSSINDIIYFSGSNVGIGVQSPLQALDINGGMRLNTVGLSEPTCDANNRGTFWVKQTGAGVKDYAETCIKFEDNSYNWVGIGNFFTLQDSILFVYGGVQLYSPNPRPICNETNRGVIWFYRWEESGAQQDGLAVCAKKTNGQFVWTNL